MQSLSLDYSLEDRHVQMVTDRGMAPMTYFTTTHKHVSRYCGHPFSIRSRDQSSTSTSTSFSSAPLLLMLLLLHACSMPTAAKRECAACEVPASHPHVGACTAADHQHLATATGHGIDPPGWRDQRARCLSHAMTQCGRLIELCGRVAFVKACTCAAVPCHTS